METTGVLHACPGSAEIRGKAKHWQVLPCDSTHVSAVTTQLMEGATQATWSASAVNQLINYWRHKQRLELQAAIALCTVTPH